MTREQKSHHRRPEQLRDILKRVLEGWTCKILCGQCELYHLTMYGGDIMCDFDDFEDESIMGEDSLEDHFIDEVMDDSDDMDDGSHEDNPEADEFSEKDAFYLGGAMGWAYEEGLEKRKQRKLLKKNRSEQYRSSE